MCTPAAVAASQTSVPGATRTARPSTVMPTRPSSTGGAVSGVLPLVSGIVVVVSGRRGSCGDQRLRVPAAHGAGAGAAVGLELVAEGGVGAQHEPRRRVAERAEALAVHVVADVREGVELGT